MNVTRNITVASIVNIQRSISKTILYSVTSSVIISRAVQKTISIASHIIVSISLASDAIITPFVTFYHHVRSITLGRETNIVSVPGKDSEVISIESVKDGEL